MRSRVSHLSSYPRDRHNAQVVVVDRLSQFFGHRLVDFIGVHNRRHDVLLAVNLTAEAVGFLVEPLGAYS